MNPHPQQPIIKNEYGTKYYKGNAIIRFLLDAGPFDMNQIARMPFNDEDRAQFAQLIGYTVAGYNELSYT